MSPRRPLSPLVVMVGDPGFAGRAAAAMATRMPPIVRFIYDRDSIPRQPGRALGRFAHFGVEMWARRESPGRSPVRGNPTVQDITIAGLMGARSTSSSVRRR